MKSLTAMSPRKTSNHRTRVGKQRSARTETRILEAALGVFADLGPDVPKIDDFVVAAGISRGTFYNHFDSVDELLHATAQWTTRDMIQTITAALDGVDGPALRLGVGLRLFLKRAQADRVWSRFVGRVWSLGGREIPESDLEAGVRMGAFRLPSTAAARDVLFGGVREALLRIGNERTGPAYPAEVTEVVLQALGLDARRIAAVLEHELPALPARDAPTKRRAAPKQAVASTTDRRAE